MSHTTVGNGPRFGHTTTGIERPCRYIAVTWGSSPFRNTSVRTLLLSIIWHFEVIHVELYHSLHGDWTRFDWTVRMRGIALKVTWLRIGETDSFMRSLFICSPGRRWRTVQDGFGFPAVLIWTVSGGRG